MTFTLNGLPSIDPIEDQTRSFLIWGKVGAGKTPLLATLPAPILWIMFDKDGYQSIAHLKHRYEMFNFHSLPDAVTEEFMKINSPLMKDLDSALKSGTFKSLVVDSLSSFLDKALPHGLTRLSTGKGASPTVFEPQLRGYGARGTIIKTSIAVINQLTSRYNVNLGLAAHEKDAVVLDDGKVEVTMMLGGEANVQIPKNVSEVWRLEDKGARRMIYVRNMPPYAPMRTRLFNATREFFQWKLDMNTWDGETPVDGTLEYYLNKWVENKGRKLELPQ